MSTTTTTSVTTIPAPQNGGGVPSGSLGVSWEIAVVVITVVIACTLIGIVTWERRKRRRRERRRASSAAEEGKSESHKEQLPPDGLAGGSTRRLDEVSEPLTKPRSAVLPYHHDKTLSSTSSSPTDYRATQPQRYYWSS